MHSRIFCNQKKKQVVLFWDFCKSDLVRLVQLSLFFPLVGSTFRMYKEYRCVYSPNYLLNWNDVIPWSIVRIL